MQPLESRNLKQIDIDVVTPSPKKNSATEQPFIPFAQRDPNTGYIVIQQTPDRTRIVSGKITTGLLTFLASYPDPVVPRQAVDEYLTATFKTTAAPSAINNTSWAIGGELRRHYGGDRGGHVVGIELPGGIRKSLRASLQLPEEEHTPEVASSTGENMEPEDVRVLRTGVAQEQIGSRREEIRIQVGDHIQTLFVAHHPARYLEILGEAGNKGISASSIADQMGFGSIVPVKNLFHRTTKILTEAEALILPEKFLPQGRTPWHRLIMRPKRPSH